MSKRKLQFDLPVQKTGQLKNQPISERVDDSIFELSLEPGRNLVAVERTREARGYRFLYIRSEVLPSGNIRAFAVRPHHHLTISCTNMLIHHPLEHGFFPIKLTRNGITLAALPMYLKFRMVQYDTDIFRLPPAAAAYTERRFFKHGDIYYAVVYNVDVNKLAIPIER
jgi:hypothetical protein